jgi:hypothetical protein
VEHDVLVESPFGGCLARDERVVRHGGLGPGHVAELSVVPVGVEVSCARVHARASERDPAYLPGSARAVLHKRLK